MKKFSHRSALASFTSAWRGIMIGVKSQKNFRTEILIALFVLLLGIFLDFNFTEIAIVVVTIGFVLLAELTNTAIEFIIDAYFKTNYSEIARMTKDLAAGAVLLAVMLAGIIGIILFLPKILLIIH